MSSESRFRRSSTMQRASWSLAVALLPIAACARSSMTSTSTTSTSTTSSPAASMSATAPSPDPRVGLRAGWHDAGQAIWNMRLVSATPPSAKFTNASTPGDSRLKNSDLAFTGNYVFQGNYSGYQVWDISNPAKPTLRSAYVCPGSQSDVTVFKNLLFVSAEATSGRTDCGLEGVTDTVSTERARGIRIFDITDVANPKSIITVQTCRGSHTNTLVTDPNDAENVYIYVSGSAGVRSSSELTGCSAAAPDQDPNSALFRIEVIKVPVAHPEQAAIVSSPRIFSGLTAPAEHGEAPEDIAARAEAVAAARARGMFTAMYEGREIVVSPRYIGPMLDSVVKRRGGSGPATAADSATLRRVLPGILATMMGGSSEGGSGPRPGPTQCHDITVYPAIGLGGGACEGYGMLLDIRTPTNPVRLTAVSDSNFSYWHSATFNNDGTKMLFTDEWGGGGQPKCRATDKKEWGANAIFTLENNQLQFKSYYKLPAAQTPQENCVAHNGSLIPIPGRDVMVQSWYQGGISMFDWTDASNPKEIAYFDRGPVDPTRMEMGGTWSVYWYNGVIVSSEIARGLDILELTPSGFISQNEIDAAKSVRFEYLNAQGQPKLVWPPTFALARAYVDQLERSNGLATDRIAAVRQALSGAERASGAGRRDALTQLATQLNGDAGSGGDAAKVRMLAGAVGDLASAAR